jgi:light-regulated signal transduction histidine kinase (bacteriophytochrome)
MAQADPVLIKLVMQELLDNAWKFTSRKSHTNISFGLHPVEAGTVGNVPVYVIRDNGEGFDMAHTDKLFRNFQRLHTEQHFPGRGVGLVKVQRIITRHGGRIWAESTLHQGASFFFTLGNAVP